ncbi:AmmeMemoRadiSam system protein B [Candidatus Uhrbacteria bacterium]|nr:AmmeMemoRadiSam system protein B [Candidatus Uhrbacteria bacterium]
MMLSAVLLSAIVLTAPALPSRAVRVHDVRDSVVERLLTRNNGGRRPYSVLGFSRVDGAIVSHHIPNAMGLNIALYKGLSALTRPRTFVVLGPNHQDIGGWPIVTTTDSFQTRFGIVQADRGAITTLQQQVPLPETSALFNIEHSIYSQVQPIAAIFPGARIVPIAISSTYSVAQAQALGKTLARVLPKDAIVIASIDFSHYHSAESAAARERKSAQLLKTLAVDAVELVDTDSQQSLAALLSFVKARGATTAQVFDVVNSAQLGGSPSYTTGYVIAAFGRSAKSQAQVRSR